MGFQSMITNISSEENNLSHVIKEEVAKDRASLRRHPLRGREGGREGRGRGTRPPRSVLRTQHTEQISDDQKAISCQRGEEVDGSDRHKNHVQNSG